MSRDDRGVFRGGGEPRYHISVSPGGALSYPFSKGVETGLYVGVIGGGADTATGPRIFARITRVRSLFSGQVDQCLVTMQHLGLVGKGEGTATCATVQEAIGR